MKGVHSQPLLLFLCWFMAWGGLKRLLIFILLRQTAFGIKGQENGGVKERWESCRSVENYVGDGSQVSALGHEGKGSIKSQPCGSLVTSIISGCRYFCAVLPASEHAWGCRHVHVKNSLAYRQVCVQRENWSWERRKSTVCMYMGSSQVEAKLEYTGASAQWYSYN